MVLVRSNTSPALELGVVNSVITELDQDANIARIRAVNDVMERMEERRRSLQAEELLDASSFSGSPRSTRSLSPRNTSLSRTSMRGMTMQGNLRNESVPFTNLNCAITKTYSSPRQAALSDRSASRGSLFQEQDRKDTRLGPLNELRLQTQPSFDYDENEEVALEEVRTYKRPLKIIYRTEDIYRKSCSLCGICPSQTYVRQITTTREVAMANTSLSHITVKPIAISLVRDHRIHTVDISGNSIGALGVTYVAEMLAENDTIYELNLSTTNPGRRGLTALARALVQNRGLHCLWLEANFIDHTETDCIVDIIKASPNLSELHLGHNNLGYQSCELLAEELQTNTTLRILDLQWNHIRKESAKNLCNAIKVNTGLRTLDLSWNGLGKEGCISLARSLPSNNNLRSLNLTNNRIDLVALPFLLHGLVRNKSLQTLEIGKNPMTTEGVKAVVRAVTGSKNMALTHLNIEDVPVDKEFSALVQKMKTARKIKVDHGPEMYNAVELKRGEHDPHDLNRFDPVMVLMEYMRIDNLRLIDLFQFFDSSGRGLVSRTNLKNGVATLGLPLTEHHLDCIMKDIDKRREGYIDLEHFMIAQRDMAKVVIQRTTRAKGKGKEDLGLKELRKILKELVEKRNQRNKEKATKKNNFAAVAKKVKSIVGLAKTDMPLEREATFGIEAISNNNVTSFPSLVVGSGLSVLPEVNSMSERHKPSLDTARTPEAGYKFNTNLESVSERLDTTRIPETGHKFNSNLESVNERLDTARLPETGHKFSSTIDPVSDRLDTVRLPGAGQMPSRTIDTISERQDTAWKPQAEHTSNSTIAPASDRLKKSRLQEAGHMSSRTIEPVTERLEPIDLDTTYIYETDEEVDEYD